MARGAACEGKVGASFGGFPVTLAETLILVIAVTAVTLATISLVWTKRLQKSHLELAAPLRVSDTVKMRPVSAKRTLGERTRVSVDLVYAGCGWFFHLTNEGAAPAREIRFELVDYHQSERLLDPGSIEASLPGRAVLDPGATVKLLTFIRLGVPNTYSARVSWINSDGSTERAQYHLCT